MNSGEKLKYHFLLFMRVWLTYGGSYFNRIYQKCLLRVRFLMRLKEAERRNARGSYLKLNFASLRQSLFYDYIQPNHAKQITFIGFN